jgi:folate-dependent phosphoribosylglycinamide formyltransferase PurN
LVTIEPKMFESVQAFSVKVFGACEAAGVDLICLGGWLSLLDVPGRWMGRVMNIHPALLPTPFGGKGMYGPRVHEAVLSHGCKVSGCTVHFVDNNYDSGPIILQRCCAVLEDDTPATLAARVAALEHEAYPVAIRLFMEGRLSLAGRRVRVRPAAPDAGSAAPRESRTPR